MIREGYTGRSGQATKRTWIRTFFLHTNQTEAEGALHAPLVLDDGFHDVECLFLDSQYLFDKEL